MVDGKRVTVEFGALSDMTNPISKQLKGALPRADLLQFDKDAWAITRLKARGMMTDREAMLARKRLLARVAREARGKAKS